MLLDGARAEYSRALISGFRPSRASRAIWGSCAVSAPATLRQLALAHAAQIRPVTWRQGTRTGKDNPDAAMTSWLLAIRVRPAGRPIPREAERSLPACWLLAEWPPEAGEPAGYWLSTLPEDTPLKELVRLAKIRWRVEHDYRELIDEDHLIAEVTGNPPVAYTAMTLAAWRGQETPASELIEITVREATASGQGRLVSFADYASAVLYNGLGHHAAARDAAWRAFERDQLGYGPLVVPELAEAACRTGDVALATAALEWLSERTHVTSTEWALGIEALVRALLSDGEAAESLYRESIERLGGTRVRAQLTRAHLLYGEWLRGERRRADARGQLCSAHDMPDAMGIGAFAERAGRELLATGEAARKRAVETAVEPPAQEAQVVRLAREGMSNPEIGARLFISARTVKYHLAKVFTKLDISSRGQLHRALPAARPH